MASDTEDNNKRQINKVTEEVHLHHAAFETAFDGARTMMMVTWRSIQSNAAFIYRTTVPCIRCSLSAILYVDNTDLLHINMGGVELINEAHIAIKSAIANWGKLLITTGGSLKPEKCFYHLIDFVWTRREGGNTSLITKTRALPCSSRCRLGLWHRSHTLPSMMLKKHLGGNVSFWE